MSWGLRALLGPSGASWGFQGPGPLGSWGLPGPPGASRGLLWPPGASWGLRALLGPSGVAWGLLGTAGGHHHDRESTAALAWCSHANMGASVPQYEHGSDVMTQSHGHGVLLCNSNMNMICPRSGDATSPVGSGSGDCPHYKSKAPLQVQGPTTSPRPHYKFKAPKGVCFNSEPVPTDPRPSVRPSDRPSVRPSDTEAVDFAAALRDAMCSTPTQSLHLWKNRTTFTGRSLRVGLARGSGAHFRRQLSEMCVAVLW